MAKLKYLLSTGRTTESLEKYIVDLFRLNIGIEKDDIPGSEIGFDFNLSDVKDDEILVEIRRRLEQLITKIKSRLSSGSTIDISVETVEMSSSNLVKASVKVNDYIDIIDVNI